MAVSTVSVGDDLRACCNPMSDGVLDSDAAERLAHLFRALAEPTRVRLVSMLAAQPSGEACVCDLTDPIGLSQPTVSHHLKQLVDAGLITREQRGRWSYYRIVDGALNTVADALVSPQDR